MHAVLPQSPIYMSTHTATPHQGATTQQPNEFEFLQAAFVEYAGALQDAGESSRSRLLNLTAQLQAKGVHGSNALQLIQQYSAQINWQEMAPEVFNSFYRFVYFICREPNKRNVQVSTAVAAWRMVLRGRFRLLDRWCAYVSTHIKAAVVLEDTWRQVLDFSRTVHEDLSNYDPASAWPVLLDEFVEHLKGARRGTRPPPLSVEPMDLLAPWSARGMTAMSPRSGSKRRPPDVMEVADQLQQLPLLSAGEQLASACGDSAAAAGACRADGSGSAPQRQLLPKRLRMGTMGPPTTLSLTQQQQQQQGSQQGLAHPPGTAATAPAGNAVMHHRRLTGGQSLALQQQEGMALNLTPGTYTAEHGSSHVHQSSSSRVVAAGGAAGPAYALPAGLAMRETGRAAQQQHGLITHQPQQMDVSALPDTCGSQDMMDVSSEQQQHQRRTSRVTAMMQVTVTETLGLN